MHEHARMQDLDAQFDKPKIDWEIGDKVVGDPHLNELTGYDKQGNKYWASGDCLGGEINEIYNIEKADEKCAHCEFLNKTFGETLKIKDSTNREYWLFTEMFVYLHKADSCQGVKQSKHQRG